VWYRSQSAGAEHEMKRALKQGRDNVLNIYSTSGGAYLGYAYLPEITDTAQAYLDGIVIDWRTMPGVSDEYEGVSDEGDTPPQKFASSGCLRATTPARRPASTRFTTTWTTRTTRASPISRLARSSGCAIPGCSGARPDTLGEVAPTIA
jgi:hypothetical protein